MVLETIIHPDFQSNFLNLSLLICDLFVGGNFRTAHILYHPEVFDDRILNDIDSACPFQMPRTTIDISAPESAFSNQNQQTDRILQIIFLPPLQLAESMGHIKELLTFYRVYVFSSSNITEFEHANLIKNAKIISNRNSSSLLLVHNKSSGATDSYLMSKASNIFMERVDLQKSDSNSRMDIFESGLGDKAIERYFGVYFMDLLNCYGKQFNMRLLSKNLRSFGRLYFFRFNMSFADGYIFKCNKSKTTTELSASVHSDLSSNYEPVQMDSR